MTIIEFLLKYGAIIGWILLIIGIVALMYEVGVTINSPKRIRKMTIIAHIIVVSILLSIAITFLIFFAF